MRASLIFILAALSLCFLGLGDARADAKSEAKQHFAAGEARFKAGDYKGAVAEFSAADALVPSPILSYNIALCHEKLGDDGEAVKFFKDYLKRRPDAQNKAAVEERIAAAEKRIAAKQPKVEGPVAPAPPPGKVEGPALPVPDAPKPTGEGPAAPQKPVDDALVQQLPGGRPSAPPPAAPEVADLGPAERAPVESAPLMPAPEKPGPGKDSKKAKPLYKEWWFWAVVGVSAIIVIDMMNDDSPSNDAKPTGLMLRF